MEHIEGRFTGLRNLEIYYQGWLPADGVKAVLLVVHGLGEHGGRYMNVVNHFVPLGFGVYALDHIGHGKSEGPREFVRQYTDFTQNLNTFYRMVVEWQPEKPVFLLGHSMGGGIAAYYLLDYQDDFKGAILSAPAVKVGESVSPATINISKILSKIAPQMGVIALDATQISRDPAVVEAYLNDPLVFKGKTPARLASEMLVSMQRITAEARTLRLPLLLLQGGKDALVEPAGAQMLYDAAQSTDKAIHIYDELFHEVFNEPEREQVLKDVEAWLLAHL